MPRPDAVGESLKKVLKQLLRKTISYRPLVFRGFPLVFPKRRGGEEKLSEDFYPRGVSAAFLPRQRSSHAADIMAAPNRQQPPSRNFCSSVRLSSSLRLLTAGGERNCPTWLELQ